MTDGQNAGRWFIDLDWLEQHNRSFLVLARGCLCSGCRERLGVVSAAELIANIRDCCSRTPEFITDKSPVLESVFRLLLANGNQPLELAELARQLAERRSDSFHRSSEEFLVRLLANDQYYGLRLVAEA